MLITECPFCHAKFETEKDWIGLTTACPECGKEFKISVALQKIETPPTSCCDLTRVLKVCRAIKNYFKDKWEALWRFQKSKETPSQMLFRLDSLSLEELKKLYTRSAYLYQIGRLQFVASIIFAIGGVVALSSNAKIGILPLLLAFYFFISSFVFKHVRVPVSRLFFYLWAISGMGYTLMSLWRLLTSDADVVFLQIIVPFFTLAICIAILISATTDRLFGMHAFTHKQIRYAKRKKSNNESFTDEEIPVKRPEEAKAKVFLILAFIVEGLAILLLVINLFGGFRTGEEPRSKMADIGMYVNSLNEETDVQKSHSIVISRISQLQRDMQGEQIGTILFALRNLRDDLARDLSNMGTPADYKNAVLRMLDQQYDSIRKIKEMSESPYFQNLSADEKLASVVYEGKKMQKVYAEFNTVCRKYKLREISESSGAF